MSDIKNIEKLEIYQTILDQESLMFTGRINILDKKTSGLLGTIMFLEGDIHSCNYKKRSGLKSLITIFYDESKTNQAKYIIEPEVFNTQTENTRIKFSDNIMKIRDAYGAMWNSAHLRPNENLFIVLNSDFVVQGEEISSDEFVLMKTIVDFGKVSEIYKNCLLDDYFTTMSLVSLRKKGAFKVIKYK